MAKKSKSAQKRELTTEDQARAARREHVVEQYGEPEFSCDYKLDPYTVNEMSLLIGVQNDRVWLNTIAIVLCAILVLMLMRDRSLVGVGVVLVVVIVLVMSAGERINRIKAGYLKRHGYDTDAMTDEELVREVYLTDSDVLVECPGISLTAYPLEELQYTRSNADFLIVSFGKARYALFPRQGFSLSNYTRLTQTLVDKTPVRWYNRLASLGGRKR